jgi:hypothetical protein
MEPANTSKQFPVPANAAEVRESLRKMSETVEFLLIGIERQYAEAKRLKRRIEAMNEAFKRKDCQRQ